MLPLTTGLPPMLPLTTGLPHVTIDYRIASMLPLTTGLPPMLQDRVQLQEAPAGGGGEGCVQQRAAVRGHRDLPLIRYQQEGGTETRAARQPHQQV